MKKQARSRVIDVMLASCLFVVGGIAPSLAGESHGGGGYHGGGGGYRGGYSGGGWGGGYRGGYGGWGWGGVGLGLGVGLGIYYASLPFGYTTYWAADGSPYYYGDNNYYQWDANANEYQTVSAPTEVQQQAASQPVSLIVYPKNGQSAAQQATDERDCRAWAASQTPGSTTDRADYMRAESACLEGRGYVVR